MSIVCQNPLHNPSSKSRCIVDLPRPDTNLPINWCVECFYNGIINGSLSWKLNFEDNTMQTLYNLAKELGPPPLLPDSLKDSYANWPSIWIM